MSLDFFLSNQKSVDRKDENLRICFNGFISEDYFRYFKAV